MGEYRPLGLLSCGLTTPLLKSTLGKLIARPWRKFMTLLSAIDELTPFFSWHKRSLARLQPTADLRASWGSLYCTDCIWNCHHHNRPVITPVFISLSVSSVPEPCSYLSLAPIGELYFSFRSKALAWMLLVSGPGYAPASRLCVQWLDKNCISTTSCCYRESDYCFCHGIRAILHYIPARLYSEGGLILAWSCLAFSIRDFSHLSSLCSLYIICVTIIMIRFPNLFSSQ